MIVTINNIEWQIVFIPSDDPLLFVDDDYTLGVTDLNDRRVYIADDLNNGLFYYVLWHELVHCWLYSYGYQIDLPCEELICQVVEKESDQIQNLANYVYWNI